MTVCDSLEVIDVSQESIEKLIGETYQIKVDVAPPQFTIFYFMNNLCMENIFGGVEEMNSIEKNIKLWDRQKNESDKAYSAFKVYLEMENRSLQKVSEKLSKSRQLLSRWLNKFNWKERAAAYDSSVIEEVRQRKIRQRIKDIELQDKIGKLIQSKSVEIFQNTDTKKGTFYAATQMAEVGCKLVNEAYEFIENATSNDSGDITIVELPKKNPKI